MSVNDTWMPLYLGDYLADTGHLSPAEHGAYLLLLMHYWRNGPLPNDQEALLRIVRAQAAEWRKIKDKALAFFTVLDDGLLHQKRMDKERARWSGISEKRREAGRAGAQAKWQPKREHPPANPNGTGMANAIAIPVDNDSNRIANATEVPSQNAGFDGKCHDFAITPVPLPVPKVRQEGELREDFHKLTSESPVLAPVREDEPSEAAVEASRLEFSEDIAALPKRLANSISGLSASLRMKAYPPREPIRTRNQQVEVLEAMAKPRRGKPCPVAPVRSVEQQLEILAAMIAQEKPVTPAHEQINQQLQNLA